MSRAAIAAIIALLAAAPSASAIDVTTAELSALAERAAQGDQAALAQLGTVTSADGVAVDVPTALAGASGEQLDARLEELAASARATPPPSPDSGDQARQRAAEIGADGSQTAPASRGDGGGIELPAIPIWLAVGLAVLAVAAGLLFGRSAARRRVAESPVGEQGEEREAPPRPRSLEREADEAERRGEYAHAIRLRFRAGLERLNATGALSLRPALTVSGAAREVHSPRLAELAVDYDEIVFGGRLAGAADAAGARSGWNDVLREVEK